MKKFTFTILTFFLIISLSAQDNINKSHQLNPREIRPFGISVGAAYFLTAESGIAFFSADYFAIPQLSLVANVGVTDFETPYFAVGGKGHLNSNASVSKFTPFLGVLFGSEWDEFMVQIPLGIDFISNKGFNVSLSINQIFYFDSYQGTFLDLKLGWRFKS